MALSTVSAILKRLGMGRLGRIGLEQPSATSAPGRASSSTSTSRSSAGSRVVPASASADGPLAYKPRRTDAAGKAAQHRRLGVRPHRRRRLQPPRLRRGPRRRESRDRYRLPPPRCRLLPPPRHPGRADPDRQRLLLPRHDPRARLRALGIRHSRTRPYRPQTNGKAERFIRTLLAGWAYGAIYRSSPERTAALDGWLWHYNHQRRHSALGHQPPVSRTNLLGSYI